MHMDYGSWFDRVDLGFKKDIVDCQYVSAMNPTAGSFTITERLQRNYSTFTVLMPGEADLKTVYSSILAGHLMGFQSSIAELADTVVGATIALHKNMVKSFLPSSVKFVYNWNMRELTNITQGLCLSKPEYYIKPVAFARLWMHECNRVFGDRLINEPDMNRFADFLRETAKTFFADIDQDELNVEPNIHTSFATPVAGEPAYLGVKDWPTLKSCLDGKLAEYNDSNAIMDLVLFQQAMSHVCRISRIIGNPSGNAMLVGVGGSGRQSLTRFAAYMSEMKCFQIELTKGYGYAEFREDLKKLYFTAGADKTEDGNIGSPVVFLVRS